VKNAGLLFLIALGCASDSGKMYDGPDRAPSELAMVEVNRYAQKNKLRWVVTEVSIPDGPSTRKTFQIPAGEYTLKVKWRLYDTSEGSMGKALFLPIADEAKRIDEGVETIPFAAEGGRLYRLRWASRPDASLTGDPKDMELKLVAAGGLPRLVAAGED